MRTLHVRDVGRGSCTSRLRAGGGGERGEGRRERADRSPSLLLPLPSYSLERLRLGGRPRKILGCCPRGRGWIDSELSRRNASEGKTKKVSSTFLPSTLRLLVSISCSTSLSCSTLSRQLNSAPTRRTIIRHLIILLDLSDAMSEKDLRPSRSVLCELALRFLPF